MKLRKLFILYLLVFSLDAYADRKGNGGDVVFCKDASGRPSAELLDFYEGRTLRNIYPDLGDAGWDYRQKIEFALQRLAKTSPVRAERYRKWATELDRDKDAKFLKNAQLVDIPDSQHIAIPAGCEIRQIAIQKTPQFPEDKRYTIDEDLWDLLSEDGKAGLVLHEAAFREALSFGHINSICARYLNSYLVAGKLEGMSPKDVIEFFQRVEFVSAEAAGIEIRIGYPPDVESNGLGTYQENPYFIDNTLEYYETGTIRSAVAMPNQTVTASGGTFRIYSQDDYPVFFWYYGSLQSFWNDSETKVSIGESRDLVIGATKVWLRPDGRIQKSKGISGTFVARGIPFRLGANGSSAIVEFSEDEKSMLVSNKEILMNVKGHWMSLVSEDERGQSLVPDWKRRFWYVSETYNAPLDYDIPITLNGLTARFLPRSNYYGFKGGLTFDPLNNRLRRAVLSNRGGKLVKLLNAERQPQFYPAGSELIFDKQERVISYTRPRP